MTILWCERVWLGGAHRAGAGVLGGPDVVSGAVITTAEGVITSVDTGVGSPPRNAVRLDGFTLPGLANAHSHLFHRALRSRAQRAGTFWSWRAQMYELADRLDPDAYEALATAVFAEMVLAGYTVVGEFHYLHHGPGGVPYRDPNEMGKRLLRAADRAGIRLTVLDTCYLRGGIAAADQELAPAQRRFADGSAAAWAERVDSLATDGVTARLGAAVHSVRAVDPAGIAAVGSWARTRGAVVHAHVSEQSRENTECIAAYGCTPTELIEAHSGLDDRFTAVHATHVTRRDVERLGAGGVNVCLCPTTERDLADGIGGAAALREAGARLCVGSDAHAVIDPFEEMRLVELHERLATGRRGNHDPAQLLGDGSAGGYASLGWRGGTIAPGSVADLVTLGMTSTRLAGGNDAVAATVFAATAGDVRHVVVGGREVVVDGVHLRVDVAAELAGAVTRAWGE